MKISIIVEGRTERAFMPFLREFLKTRLAGQMPALDPVPYDGHIPTGDKLKRVVQNLLGGKRKPSDHVIALSDVYTGTKPVEFKDATDAMNKMRQWVGDEERFHPHAAQHDFEAWLLPYWPTIQRLAKHNQSAPSGHPESINHDNPPAYRIKSIFEIGKCRDSYVKPRDAGRILRDNDLKIAVDACPELRAFVNTILTISGGEVFSA
ncbi:MAG: DUF4276 family protein [Desulfatibacillum sp.]|nr:DUF4276 family protein [Desulfatibacillum sp.]